MSPNHSKFHPKPKERIANPAISSSISTKQSCNQSVVPGTGTNHRPKGLNPHVNPKMLASARDMHRMREEMSEARHRDSYCQLCSEERDVYHPHFSTQHMREFATQYRSGKTYHCPMCKKEEPIELPKNTTRRIILSSSILYNVWEYPTLQVSQHIDMEAIVGGRVRDLTRALRHLYLINPNRLEIIAMVAINNIGEGQEPEKIISEMQDMKDLVAGHSKLHNHNPPSYVSFATCILPPKYCSFHVPREAPDLAEWIPSSNFWNRANRIGSLNRMIKEMNEKDNLQYVGLHLLGMKFFKSGNKQHKFDTKKGAQQIWREREVFRKLHFTQEIKAKIVNSAQDVFENNRKSKGDQKEVNPV